ncbi:hypothetical protein SEA_PERCASTROPHE_86 [Streptomyces phage Percastrophe]|uniref:Uncharacterized protein n=1 Tax=Streptomyces phage Percastrophe TaxID=2060087 RepID=A0A2H5BMC4_9CAUD|nr:hypothetical protein SEA_PERCASTROPHE_86 [Streptomyces phage Percastrophe]
MAVREPYRPCEALKTRERAVAYYTFIGLVNTVPMGSQRSASLEEIKALMACDVHGVDFKGETCESCEGSERFVSDLTFYGKAIHTNYSESGSDVYISVAATE